MDDGASLDGVARAGGSAAAEPQGAATAADYAPLRDYGLIGDGRTAALVSRAGSVDWLCLPRFDSPSLFNRLLDRWRGGFFSVAPQGGKVLARRYLEDTAVLETVFETPTGRARLRHFMPALSEDEKRGWLLPYWSLLVVVDGLEGEVDFRVALRPRPGDGRERARLQVRGPSAVAFEAHGGLVRLDCDGPLRLEDGDAAGGLIARAGERRAAWLSYTPGPAVQPALAEAGVVMERTIAYWRAWSGRARCSPERRTAVRRSAITLKLLSFAPSGAIVAAPTMGLPEKIGGERNWDYRFCWLRDAAYAAGAFYRLGYREEADAFVQWLMYATTLTHPELRVFYDLFGRPRVGESDLRLEGYRASAPVRRGNLAAEQRQLDVYGEVMEALSLYHANGGVVDRSMRNFIRGIGDFVASAWDAADNGIWEPRRPVRQYVHSKIMCWHALEQCIRLGGRVGLERESRLWRRSADACKAAVLSAGWSSKQKAFTQSFENEALDAAVLLLPGTGLLPGDDPRMLSTIAAVERTLGCGGGLLRRYDSDDGLPPGEGAFLPCSFWLAEALALGGRKDRASELLESLAARGGDLGLLSEEIDCRTGESLGNYPQALSHLAHIDAACALEGRLMEGLED